MLHTLIIAAGLVAVTVVVHAAGFGLVLGTLVHRRDPLPAETWAITWSDTHCLAAHRYPCRRNHRVGAVLPLGAMPAGRGVGVLFLRGHLHDARVWRPA